MQRLQTPFRRVMNTGMCMMSQGRQISPLRFLAARFLQSATTAASAGGSEGEFKSFNSNDGSNDDFPDDFAEFTNQGPNPTQYREAAIDELGRSYGTGRRKTAVARVWLKKGVGECIVNKRNIADYFPCIARSHALHPFIVTETAGLFDVMCTVKGGGQMGQAGAVRMGIARAIEAFEPGFKPLLKKYKLLTRDSRMVERKKAGFKKARKRKQWVKR
ncbi:rpsI [Symbiodinium microadriaticum]|nr:rpsI [Symbiodinium microadriaticum]